MAKPTGKYFKYYKNLGYDVSLKEIEIDMEHLSSGSKLKVDVKCDYCRDIKKISYCDYNKSTKNKTVKYACRDCGHLKQKDLCIEKHGTDNYFKLDSVKEKIKKTNLEKYGKESYTQTYEYREKASKTNFERYGKENYSQTDEYKERVRKTSLDRYGRESYTQTDEYREKTKQTNLEKYGEESYTQTDEYREKTKQTNLEKRGVQHHSQTDEYKEKVRKTNLEKYGEESYSRTDEYKEKTRKTNLDRYGKESYSQTDEYKESVRKTSLDRYGRESYSQTEECKMLVRNTNMEKFGFDNPMKSAIVQEKAKQTNLARYGFKYYTQTDEYREKSKQSSSDRFGTDNIQKNEIFRKRFIISNHKNYIRYLENGESLFRCDRGLDHDFSINSDNFFHRSYANIGLCTVCNPISKLSSIKEKELYEYIRLIYDGTVLENYRDSLEIDIYLPDIKIGFEFNGIFWHSDRFKERNYHLEKTNYFEKRNIRVINIWEDDWIEKNDIIKSQINNFLKLSTKIPARKCDVMEIENKTARFFLDINHIQGSYKQIIKSFGIFHENELIAVMTFDHFEGRKKMIDEEWNLSRFCNKLGFSVIGGASKLFKSFISKYHPKRIISYADKDWSTGNLYEKMGFAKTYETKPDYKYVKNYKRTHKSNFKKLEKDSKIEFPKVYDCGKIKYEIFL